MKVIFLTLIVLPILVHAGDLDDDEHKIRGGNRPEFLANCPCRLTVQVEDDSVKEWIKSHPNITVLDPIEHMPFMVIEVPNRGLAVAIIKHPGVLRVNEDASIPDGYEIKLQGITNSFQSIQPEIDDLKTNGQNPRFAEIGPFRSETF